jgi:hypothetical protein
MQSYTEQEYAINSAIAISNISGDGLKCEFYACSGDGQYIATGSALISCREHLGPLVELILGVARK